MGHPHGGRQHHHPGAGLRKPPQPEIPASCSTTCISRSPHGGSVEYNRSGILTRYLLQQLASSRFPHAGVWHGLLTGFRWGRPRLPASTPALAPIASGSEKRPIGKPASTSLNSLCGPRVYQCPAGGHRRAALANESRPAQRRIERQGKPERRPGASPDRKTQASLISFPAAETISRPG